MRRIVFLVFIIPFLQSCGNWGTVTGERARQFIDLHDTELADLPEKVIYKTLEDDQEEVKGKKE